MNFVIEDRGGVHVLVDSVGGCRPATAPEVAMWEALRAVREAPVAHVAELKDGRKLISFEAWDDNAWIASTERVRLVPVEGES